MKVGGPMPHGSVVARAYGIPAVVDIHEAIQRLKTGQRVRVDGSAGWLVVLDGGSLRGTRPRFISLSNPLPCPVVTRYSCTGSPLRL